MSAPPPPAEGACLGQVVAVLRGPARPYTRPGSFSAIAKLPVAGVVAVAGTNRSAAILLDRAGYWLGRALGGAITLLGLPDVLLTGETTVLWDHMEVGFATGLAETVLTLPKPPRIARRPWDADATAVGAAGLALARVISGGVHESGDGN